MLLQIYIVLEERNYSDEALANDKNLRLSVSKLSKENNAFSYISKAIKRTSFPRNRKKLKDILERKAWDKKFVRIFLRKNEKAFVFLQQALDCKEAALALRTSIPASPYYKLGQLKRLMNLLEVKILYALRQKDHERAWKMAMDLMRFGALLANAKNYMRHLLSYIAFEKSYKTIRILSTQGNFSPEFLKSAILQLENYEKLYLQGYKNAIRAEYLAICGTIDLIASGKANFLDFKKIMPQTQYSFKPKATKNLFINTLSKYLKERQSSYKNQKCIDVKLEKELQTIAKNVFFFLTPNGIGRTFYKVYITDFRPLIDLKLYHLSLHISTKTLLAIKCYQQDTGKLPTHIKELTPLYLKQIPRDPYDGSVLEYSFQKKTIYLKAAKYFDEERYKKLNIKIGF